MKTTVINIRDRGKFVGPKGEAVQFVFIGRPSKWGNPFKLQDGVSREDCLVLYKGWVTKQPDLMAALGELRGKVLGCWCKPEMCHGEVLARLADGAAE